MAFVGWALLLLFLAQLHSMAGSGAHARSNLAHHSASSLCLPDQASALLKLKQSFFFNLYSTTTLPSWQAGTDCCLWEGVGCSNSSGHVAALNLSGFELYSTLGIDPVLFNLTSLRLLDLSMNDFSGTDFDDTPSVGFERLTLLTHLNLSHSDISGPIPAGIGKLTNLISLDLSWNEDFAFIDDPSKYRFPNSIANLTNLRELILDGLFISSRAEDCFKALAKSTPHLRVLSLQNCGLQGHIDRSLSGLRNLEMIDLSFNYFMTPGLFPEFIMNFLNLSVLRLAGINLEGRFPRGIFQSKNLRVLDLSRNPNLLGHMPNFSNASSLKILRLDMTSFSYAKSRSSSNFNSVMELGLDGNFISMDFLSSFNISVSLRKLVLTQISSLRNWESVFSWIHDIRNLSLVLYNCDFFKGTPSSIRHSKSNLRMQTLSAVTNLKNLKSLSIIGCDIYKQLPSAIGNMSNLERLIISNCYSITGPIPHEVGALTKLKSLKLTYTGLSGGIPSLIGNLTQLTELVLYGNQLSGRIPTSIFTLPALQDLDLSSNQLSGPIQEFDVISSHLKTIVLSQNKLMGPIPESFFLLTSLSYLSIAWNNFTGSVDLASLWRLENLTYLVLSNNKLSVTDGKVSNSSATYLSALQSLGLSNCNITKIPNSLTHINHIFDLDLSSNKLSGNIPKWIWERWPSSLQSLNLSHNKFTGMELTSYIIPFSRYLYTFDLSSNRLRGQIPMPSLSAEFLDYSNNIFSSVLPNFTLYLSNTYYLSLSNNNISGYLPHSICDARIAVLDLTDNNFKGMVPPCLMENGLIMVLNLGENKFEGALPSNISSGCSLRTVDLNGNKIEGQLPRTLYNCADLEVLNLGGNNIIDTFPSWLGTLLNLRVLVLRSNQFHGSIGYLKDEKPRENFSSLLILDLASNNFSGNLHPRLFENLKSMKKYNNTEEIIRPWNLTSTGFYQDRVTFERILTTLTEIDLSDNALEGSIPASIGKLVSLRVLNMSHNAFTREIPRQFGGMTSLEFLDLSSNMLSGEIPQELTNLTFLSILNLSDNQLEGIPQSHQFATFQNSTFDGNAGLCGQPLSSFYGNEGLEPANCNITEIPNLLTRVSYLYNLDLSSNKLSGDIPNWIWGRWYSNLLFLNLSHNMFTGMELTSYIIPFSGYLEVLDLSSNRLQGQIPMPSLSAGFLDYSNNTFSSVLPNFTLYLSYTFYLSLSKNNISGYLPHSICDKHIEVLDLSYNNFKGMVPPCLMENGSNMVLNLRENKFHGVLPSNISSVCSLQTVDFSGNKIEGELPRTLYNCADLEVLDMGKNQITDTFPSWLGRLLNLRVLILRSNHFHGSIGYLKDEKSGEHFPSLQIIDVASNNFSGTLHLHWFEGLISMQKYNNTGQIIQHGNLIQGLYQDSVSISYKGSIVTFERVLSTLTAIDLSDNALEDSIPASIGKLVSLRVLNLSHNAFTGDIPPQLGGITALEVLDLSTNILSGEIPQEITDLTFLSILNFSNNRLEGRIPQSYQFSTFQNSSFDGNAGLCGQPLSKQCGTPGTLEVHLKGPSSSVNIVLFLFVGMGFGVGFAAAMLVKLDWIKKWFRKVNSANMT